MGGSKVGRDVASFWGGIVFVFTDKYVFTVMEWSV